MSSGASGPTKKGPVRATVRNLEQPEPPVPKRSRGKSPQSSKTSSKTSRRR